MDNNNDNNYKLFAGKYIPRFQTDYFKLQWFERNLMTYFDHLKYQECAKNPDDCFDRVNVINFDIIHNNCRGDRFDKSVKDPKTVLKTNFVEYPNKAKENVVSALFKNKRDD